MSEIANVNVQTVAQADMGAFFGRKAAEQAQVQQATMGGPPVVPLITEPYFVGGPETLLGRFEALRDCGVGVVDLAWGIGDPTQREAAMDRFAADVLPLVQGLQPGTRTNQAMVTSQ